MTREERIEAVAEAWASLDGEDKEFRTGKTASNAEDFRGHYAGYMSDAEELVARIAKRGFVLLPREPTEEMVEAAAKRVSADYREGDYLDEDERAEVWVRARSAVVGAIQAYEQSKQES